MYNMHKITTATPDYGKNSRRCLDKYGLFLYEFNFFRKIIKNSLKWRTLS